MKRFERYTFLHYRLARTSEKYLEPYFGLDDVTSLYIYYFMRLGTKNVAEGTKTNDWSLSVWMQMYREKVF